MVSVGELKLSHKLILSCKHKVPSVRHGYVVNSTSSNISSPNLLHICVGEN